MSLTKLRLPVGREDQPRALAARCAFVFFGIACAALVFATSGAATARAEALTIERMFAAPDLAGPNLRSAQISPDSRRITFLQGKADNKDRLDLWEFDLASRRTRLLVDSAVLVPTEARLSAEEEQRRERQRISSLSGIVEYLFAPDGKALLFPLGGDLYYYDLRASADQAVRRLTSTEAAETDARFSPHARYVSFVRDQDLFVIDLHDGAERALTTDGEGMISNGMAEFIAQEEMGRQTGYWWSPDERRVAYARVDESPVEVRQRFEISADDVEAIDQRYPAAGTPNAIVELRVVELESGAATKVDLGDEADIYLPRVDWFPDSQQLAVQRQSRDQRRLDLLKVDTSSGTATTLITETSPAWIDLYEEITFLPRRKQFVWASSRSGFKHLYLHDYDGKLVRPITAGPWMVVGDGDARALLGVDEKRGTVWFMANERTPLERHLYRTTLDTANPERVTRITREDGWFSIALAQDRRFFLATYSNPDRPPRVTVHGIDGSLLATLIDNQLDPSHPYFRYLDSHRPTEFGTLKAEDGQTLHYQLITPPAFDPARKYPLLVDVYGGPGVQRVRKAWGARGNEVFFRQFLAQNGYVVLTLDNRGTAYRGDAFEKVLHKRMGKVEVTDQAAGVRRFAGESWFDPQRVGIFGWSYGGYMALMATMTAPGVFTVGVAGAPVTDWALYDTHYTERFLETPAANAGGYEQSAVLGHASRLQAPLLVIHGMADDNVLFSHSTKLFKRLQDLNKPFDIMAYPGSKHGLLRHAGTGPHAYTMIKAFLDEHLAPPGGSAPAAASSGAQRREKQE